jgi:UDP-N-acetylmuramoylalanine--D-glutamate ligase
VIPVTFLEGQRVALFGLGGSGLATARALLAGGAEVVAEDDDPGRMEAAAGEGITTGDLRSEDWSRFALFVLSPGVPLTHPEPHWTVRLAQAQGVAVVGDVELFARERRHVAPQAPLVAITGTNGKSTTTALTAHVLAHAGLAVSVGGNIGRAVLDLEPLANDRAYVVECSSFQIDLAPTLDPTAGVHLNLTPDHLDRHGTLENYAAIKERLIQGVPPHGTAVVGVDDAPSRAIAERAAARGVNLVRLSVQRPLEDGIFLESSVLVRARAGQRESLADLAGIDSLRGAHNAQNAGAAIAAAQAIGLDLEAIRAGLASFPGLAHRMEIVGRKGRVRFVNDSKGTNADAAAHALSSFDTIYWIAGGRAKAGGIDSLKPFFTKIAKAYLIGEAASDFARTLGEQVEYEISGTMARAVEQAARDAASSGAAEPVVLLSPACASFDQYRSFEVRGNDFRGLVQALPGFVPGP